MAFDVSWVVQMEVCGEMRAMESGVERRWWVLLIVMALAVGLCPGLPSAVWADGEGEEELPTQEPEVEPDLNHDVFFFVHGNPRRLFIVIVPGGGPYSEPEIREMITPVVEGILEDLDPDDLPGRRNRRVFFLTLESADGSYWIDDENYTYEITLTCPPEYLGYVIEKVQLFLSRHWNGIPRRLRGRIMQWLRNHGA